MMEMMLRYIFTLILLVAALPEVQAHGYQDGYDDGSRKDRLYDLIKGHHGCGDAYSTEATTSYRICSPRPQRVHPTVSHSGGKMTGRASANHFYKPFNIAYSHVAFHKATSGFCADSRQDYIYVLRHIII